MFREQKKYFVVFGKEPIKGFSKTRLAEDLGEKASLRLYDAFIKDFFINLKRAQEEDFTFEKLLGHLELFVTPSRNQSFNYFKRILNELELDKFKISFQSEQSFFERLKIIFKEIN